MVELKQDQLNYLIELQQIETDAKQYEGSLKGVQEKISAQEEKLKKAEKQYEIDEVQYQNNLKILKSLEMEIEDIELRIAKSNETIKSVSNNKEYQVLRRELDDNAKRKAEMEEQILELISQTEEEESKLNEQKSQLDALYEKITSDIKEIKSTNSDDMEALEIIDKKRKELTSKIDSYLLSRFNKTLELSDGIAIVKVFNETCGGCFLSVPPQLFIEMKKGGELHFCPQCHRMVYYDGD